MGRFYAMAYRQQWIDAGHFFTVTFFATNMLLMCTSTSAVPANFILGDSLVDAGNNNYLALSLAKANLCPNGIDYGDGQPTGRFCNGRTVPDILFTLLGAPIPQPYLAPSTHGAVILNGVNYASGAAGILDSTGYNYVQRLPFNLQLSNFQQTVEEIESLIGRPSATKLLNNALYYIVFGSNDYINNYLLRGSQTSRQYNPQQYQDLLLSTFRRQLTNLYNIGARKILVFAMGPLGCIPSQIVTSSLANGSSIGGCISVINQYCQSFNAAVNPMLVEMNAALPGAKFCYGNVYAIVSQFIENPSPFGFKVTNAGCCGMGPNNGLLACIPISNLCSNRSNYLFWDPFHPSDRANVFMANWFYTGGLAYISPYNVQQLSLM